MLLSICWGEHFCSTLIHNMQQDGSVVYAELLILFYSCCCQVLL
jgi:hypothetical protein